MQMAPQAIRVSIAGNPTNPSFMRKKPRPSLPGFPDARWPGGFAMGTFKRATVSLNSNAVSIIDEVFYAAWDILRSHDPFRELREGSELQISIKQRIFAFASEAVIDSIQLHKQALEGTLASNQAVRPSTRLRTPIVPRRMQRVGK